MVNSNLDNVLVDFKVMFLKFLNHLTKVILLLKDHTTRYANNSNL
jgi:hypothetical protein